MTDVLAEFSEATQAWFTETFGSPTRVQRLGWPRIAAGEHTLMLAPTGSGKTLAAFLWCLDHLTRTQSTGGTRVIYVSPIKALAHDIERNLRLPLFGIEQIATDRRITLRSLRIDIRTGDTSPAERRRQLRDPGDVLITTPESLYLLLGSAARKHLTGVETVIIDEIHAVAATKRGVHLALSLERLSAHCTGAGRRDPQRIGLSATQTPLDEIARFLGGDRPVAVVDAGEPPKLDLEIVVPVADMTAPPPADPNQTGFDTQEMRQGGMWPALYSRLLEMVLAHRTTILFVNSRRLAERLASQLSELARATGACEPGDELVRAHHGSVARPQRVQIEEQLKSGRLRAITATSSLELGIDMGSVDLVVQVESPGSVSRGLQRVGRAGHQVGAISCGRIVPKFRGDLLEAAACVRGMLDGAVEPTRLPENCLDVLAQQIVAMCSTDPWPIADLERVITRAASYRGLTRTALTSVLDMLAGRYPSDELADLRPRLNWDRTTDSLTARPGARLLSIISGGTIPDRGLYPVHLGATGPRVGELDEEMVHESRRGETFLLGATTWRIEDVTRDRVVVSPAPGEPGKMPFWRGDGPVRPIELGRAVGALTRHIDELLARTGDTALCATALMASHRLDQNAADNLVRYIASQRDASAAVPTDRTIVVERFRDQLGDWRICVLTPLGGRVHAPWAHVVSRRLEDRLGYPVHPLYTDDGFALRFANGDQLPDVADLFPAADQVEELLVAELARSTRFAGLFRENAARALLLPRRRPGQRTPLWTQRQRAQQLMGIALRYPSFPIVLETYRECLRDVFDLPALRDLLAAIERREIRVDAVVTTTPSPFATSLVFDYVAAFLYQGDAPAAERKAQALALDRTLLRELLGEDELRDLLAPEAIREVEDELAGRAPTRRARTADELSDLLRRIGDASTDQLAGCAAPDLDITAALTGLEAAHRIVAVGLAGQSRWIAVEDAARYRDGLGVALPTGLPAALLGATPDPLAGLLARWARTHGPFAVEQVTASWGLPPGALSELIDGMVTAGTLVRGAWRPGGATSDLCDAEVLRRIRQRTLTRLRSQVAPVEAAGFARFLVRWQGVGTTRHGLTALRETLAQLEGTPLPLAELEARILPARVVDFAPRMLDELGAMGDFVWVGRGALGTTDGRIAIVRRSRAALLLEPITLSPDANELHHAVVLHLRQVGASFLVAIESAVAGHPRDAVRAALWDLVWAGVITNDTFAPLRSLRAKKNARPGPHASFGGRWSLVETLFTPTSPTQRAHAQAVALLDRWGVVTREAVLAEGIAGGFAALVPVFDTMEESGAVRRGLFVQGLGGRQYAWPTAIEGLRIDIREPTVVALPAADPANPWGAVLPWPRALHDARPNRRPGTWVVLVDGTPTLHLEPRAGKLITFTDPLPETLEIGLVRGLAGVALAHRRPLVIESIDGEPSLRSRWAELFDRSGFRRDYRGYLIPPATATPMVANDTSNQHEPC